MCASQAYIHHEAMATSYGSNVVALVSQRHWNTSTLIVCLDVGCWHFFLPCIRADSSEGDYIDGGSTSSSDTEWRRVFNPITEFATATEEWPNLDGVKDMYFLICDTAYSVSPRPRFHVRDLYLTDDPPSVESYSAEPSESPTLAPPSLSQNNTKTNCLWSGWPDAHLIPQAQEVSTRLLGWCKY